MSLLFSKMLHPDIWAEIIRHLKNPEPRPHQSGTTRKNIRQDDLATCMRVSIFFNRVASQHLYRRVITDCPRDLIVGLHNKAAHPDVTSERELLGRVRHLSLEYPDLNEPITYTTLMTKSDPCCDRFLWCEVGARESFRFIRPLMCLVDLTSFVSAIEQDSAIDVVDEEVIGRLKEKTCVFKLDTLCYNSTLADYGEATVIALQMLKGLPNSAREYAKSLLDKAKQNAEYFVHNSNVKHFCQRPLSTFGPLALVNLVLDVNAAPFGSESSGHRTIRSHQFEFTTPPFSSQYQVTWQYEDPTFDISVRPCYADLMEEMDCVILGFQAGFEENTNKIMLPFLSRTQKTLFKVEFFASLYTESGSSTMVSDHALNRVLSAAQERVVGRITHNLPDIKLDFSFKPSYQATICPACGI